MARVESLNILLDPAGLDYLAELYGPVIGNIEKSTLTAALRNINLSGDPVAGSVEAKRFAFAAVKPYGTARTAGKGEALKALPVTVQLNKRCELVRELEMNDTALYGVDSLLARVAAEHQLAAIRELESSFLAEAGAVATSVTPAATDPLDILEELILQVETTQNSYVNGVPRNLIHVVMRPSEYSKIRKLVNTQIQNASVNMAVEEFGSLNGVRVYSSIYLPEGVKQIALCEQSIAQPLLVVFVGAEKVNLSAATAVEFYFTYGTRAVMPELIAKITDPDDGGGDPGTGG